MQGRGENCRIEQTMQPVMPARRGDPDVHELDGAAVLFDVRSNAVHRFDAVTLFVWHACDGSRTTAEIAAAASERFQLDSDDAVAAVDRVIWELGERDLIAYGRAAAEADVSRESEYHPITSERMPSRDLVRGHARSAGLTRREVVRGGVTKLVLAAPVISTFFARSALASTVSPHGAGGCKNVGFSCTANNDCCGSGPLQTECEDSECCIKQNKGNCVEDEDCCTGLTCDGGGICRT